MYILWQDMLTRLRRHPTYEQLLRVALGFADARIRHATFSVYLNKLNESYPTDEWRTAWQWTLEQAISRIAQGKDRKEQGQLCRREILLEIETCVLKKLLAVTKNEENQDYLLKVYYADNKNLNKVGRLRLLIFQHAFSMLRLTGLSGLYLQQCNQTLHEEEFSEQYQRLCEFHTEILLKVVLASNSTKYLPIEDTTAHNEIDRVDVTLEQFFRHAKEQITILIEQCDKTKIRNFWINLEILMQKYNDSSEQQGNWESFLFLSR